MCANWSENAKIILEQRYLSRDRDGSLIETPDQMLERVVDCVAAVEKKKDRSFWRSSFLEIMDSLEFLPNSPTLMNAGKPLGQLSACFLLPIDDNLSNIFEMVKQTALIHKTGGGTGLLFSRLRPTNSKVFSTSGVASGPTSFMKVFNVATEVVKQGGVRRGANMGVLNVNHPDIFEFVKCKENIAEYQNFNISVSITDNFLKAVQQGNSFPLRNPYTKEKTYINALELFEVICEQAWMNGEPGLIFIDTINLKNPVPWLGKIEGTNPCITGDTLIAVADGRGAVTIKELTEDGKDVPVYCHGDKGKITIRMMRNPRYTGRERIIKINLDNGEFVRTTLDHVFILADGTRKKARDLFSGDSVSIMTKRKSKFETIFNHSNSHSQEYYWINSSNYPSYILDHRLIANFYSPKFGFKKVVHHVDGNGLNNKQNNLEVMLKSDHDKLHSLNMMGENNPMVRFPEKNCWNNSQWQEKMRNRNHIGRKRKLSTRNKIGIKTKERFDSPSFRAYHGERTRIGIEENRNKFNLSLLNKAEARLMDCQEKTDLECFLRGNSVFVKKFCENCGEEMISSWSARERSYCSVLCWNNVLNSKEYRQKLKSYSNHKIISFEMEDYQDVYNGTVDEFHNYYIGHFKERVEQDEAFVYINTMQCGEQPLLPYESCNLGSIDVSKFVAHKKIDWDRLNHVVEIAVRFLDDVIDANKYPNVRIQRRTLLTRKIGLGIMGWADLLISLGIRYDSEKAIKLAKRLMMNIRETAHITSRDIGKEKGYCFKQLKRRNTTLTTIAPTGTLSILANCSSGIEPLFGKKYTKTVLNGVKLDLSEKYRDIDDDLIVTSHEIPVEKHIEMQAAFQMYTDNSVSKTVNLLNSAKVDDVRKAFLLAHSLGCKGITVYRDGSRAAPIEITTEGQLSECENNRCLL